MCVCVEFWAIFTISPYTKHSWAQQTSRERERESSGRRFAYLMACSGSDSDWDCGCCDCCLSLFLGLACALFLLFFLLCAARTYARASVDCVLPLTLSFVLFDVVVVNCLSLLSCTLHNAPLITAEWESRRVRKREMMRRRERAHTSERSCCWFSLMGFYLFRKYDASLYEGCVEPPPLGVTRPHFGCIWPFALLMGISTTVLPWQVRFEGGRGSP